MPFRPEVGDEITIEGVTYTFTPHPIAPGVPYGQTGRRATIYQLKAANRFWALKVFTQAFITPRIAEGMVRLRAYARLPGLGVCARLLSVVRKAIVVLLYITHLRCRASAGSQVGYHSLHRMSSCTLHM